MIRAARPDDVPAIYGLIRDLAEYERSLPEVTGTRQQLHAALFGDERTGSEPATFAHVAEHDGAVGGFALWFLNFSTWQCRHGIYLEDLYVRPELRGNGYGRALLAELAAVCVQRGYTRLEWVVLNWIEPSIGFYRSLGAVSLDDWSTFRLTGQALADVAASRADR
jgi:GNAT superfamily N-acetyltransferase